MLFFMPFMIVMVKQSFLSTVRRISCLPRQSSHYRHHRIEKHPVQFAEAKLILVL